MISALNNVNEYAQKVIDKGLYVTAAMNATEDKNYPVLSLW